MNKMFVLLLIIGFWLFLPIPIIYMESTNQNSATIRNMKDTISSFSIENQEESDSGIIRFFNGVWSFIKLFFSFIVLLFNIMVMGFPDAGLFNYFLWFLKIISLVAIIMIVRGN